MNKTQFIAANNNLHLKQTNTMELNKKMQQKF